MSVEVSLTEKITALFQAHSLATQGADQEFVARFHASLPKIQTIKRRQQKDIGFSVNRWPG